MPLQRIHATIEREAYGFAFPMRIAGSVETVQVVISDEVFTALGLPPDDMLLDQFERDRFELEAIANEKFERGRATADGVIFISLSDVVSFFQ